MNNFYYIYLIFIILLLSYFIIKIYSFNKDIIFLHIPKNAGTSFKIMYPEIQHKNHANSFPNSNYINIAIVRNPYTRFQSIFQHIFKRSNLNGNYQPAWDLKNIKTLDDFVDAYYDPKNKNYKKVRNLLNWNKNKIQKYKYFINNGGCPKINNYGCIHWAPQYLFINDASKIDYLIKFENFNTEINKLQLMGILNKKKIIKKNQSKDIHKSLSPKAIKLVNEIYAKDFYLWNIAGIN